MRPCVGANRYARLTHCGAALSVAYERHPVLANYEKILVAVCGGATATIDQIRAWASETHSR